MEIKAKPGYWWIIFLLLTATSLSFLDRQVLSVSILKIKEGPITILSISSTYEGKFKFVIAEGESVKGPIPPPVNTNTRGYFKPDLRTFLKNWVREGPTHHFALGIGHHAATIVKVAGYLDIESKIISSF